MPISPNPMPYGFSGADIASITSARAGLTRGFEALGKQVREDIARIGTMRQLKSFSEELSSLDPQNDLFPQQALQVMAKYPLAANTQVGAAGLNMLGRMHRDWSDAKASPTFQLFQTKGGDILRVPKTTGEAEVVYDAAELPTKKELRSVPGVGLVSVDPVTEETRTLVETPEKGVQPVFVTEEGVKYYRDGTMTTPDGKVVKTIGGQLYNVTDPTKPAPLSGDADARMIFKAQLGVASQRLNAAQRNYSNELALAQGNKNDATVKALAGELTAAEQAFSGLLTNRGRPDSSGASGIGAIGADAAPVVQAPTTGGSLLPGNQSAPLPGEESILPNATSQSSYRTPNDVKQARRRGIIKTDAEAIRILQDQFGFAP